MNSPNPAYYQALAAARGVRPTPGRSWSILLTSANHGTVGPVGSTFPHAGEKHERVLVVEVPAVAGAPADQVNLQLVDLSGLRRTDWTPSGMAARADGVHVRLADVEAQLCVSSVAAQAGQVALAQPLAMVSPSELRDIQAGLGGVPVRGNQWRDDQTVPIYAAPAAGQVAVPGWISVDERLPGEQGLDSEEVLCFLSGHCAMTDFECRDGAGWGIRLGYYDAEKGMFRTGGRPDASVTHWMPLPPSPAKESK